MKYRIWLYTAFIIELGLVTFWQKAFGVYVSPVLWLCSGLFIGIFPFYYFIKQTIEIDKVQENPGLTFNRWTYVIIGFLPLAAIAILIIRDLPLFPHEMYSDVFVQSTTMAERMLSGEKVYAPMTLLGYQLIPTYLPMQWMPFVISVITGSDPRLIHIVAWLAISGYFLFGQKFNFSLVVENLIACLAPALILGAFYKFQGDALFMSFELLIAAYYLLLVLGLLKKNFWLITLAILLCLLSRYSLALWLPVFLVILYFKTEKKLIIKGAVVVVSGILLLYVIPFLLYDPGIWVRGYDYYTTAAEGEWMDWRIYPEIEPKGPVSVVNGIGMAVFFYKFIPGDLLVRINTLRLIHIIAILLFVAVFIILFLRNKHLKKLPFAILALGSLKIYLVLFYAFIQIPYHYLYLVPLAISMGIILLSQPGQKNVV